MREALRCCGYVLLLGTLASSAQQGESHLDEVSQYEVHWIEKNDFFRVGKRKAVCQKESWSLCPSSVGGGCCPDNYSCDTASCYATTAGPTSACGLANHFSCPITAGAGSCCPVGYICNTQGGCDPPEGQTIDCPVSYFNCPVSLGGGCCPDGRICGSGVCYDGTPSTYTVSVSATTTDSEGHLFTTVITYTTTMTDEPRASAESASAAGVPQLVPSTVAKEAAVQTSDSHGSHTGLSSGALGGIVAGVVVILIVVIAATTFIVLRLQKAEKAANAAQAAVESKPGFSDGHSPFHKPGFGRPSVSEIDASTDVDPSTQMPIMHPSPQVRSRAASSTLGDQTPSHTPNFTSSGASSPPIWGVAFNYAPSSNASDGRQSSLEAYPQLDSRNALTFGRVSAESHGSHGHSRQSSDASELEAPHGESELENTGPNGESTSRRRSSSASRSHNKRASDFPGQHGRGESSAIPLSPPLGTVNEIHELHGYHGLMHELSGNHRDS
ncbi:hypothetical protein F5Y18DRAFT_344964 [Xylariaceae sp. FL1019]|nr:hypothetical protein F5Y18DRAFT_344964 [Xylariaceae sp. FL1019]